MKRYNTPSPPPGNQTRLTEEEYAEFLRACHLTMSWKVRIHPAGN